jgi:beta-glucanase (GH16 family)
MSRVSVLATAAVALVIAVGGVASQSSLQLVSDDPADAVGLVVTKAPQQLELRQSGKVEVQGGSQTAPGDTVYLNTAGAYGAGFVRVSEATLDQNLAATLTIPGTEFLGSFSYWVTSPATSARAAEISSDHFSVDIVSPAAQKHPSCGDSAPRKANGVAWQCTFDDEFNGRSLDRKYWVPMETEKSKFTSGTLTKYACALDSPQTIAVRDGALDLSLVDLGEKRDCGHYKSSQYAYGQVMQYQTFSQAYGKYEVRAKIPDLQVPGSQQSFWLWPEANTYGPWPASGEIDFAEMYSSQPGLDKPFLHYLPGESPDGTDQNVTHADCPINVGEYNTYGLEWEPGKLTLLLNGKVCFVNQYSSVIAGGGSPAPFDQPFYLLLNQAMGTVGNDYDPDQVPDRLTTQIDYVRVWK